MPGAIGEARSNDIVPNGAIVPIPDLTLPGTLNLASLAAGYGNPSVLCCNCTGTFSISATGTANAADAPGMPGAGTGQFFAAATTIYIPVNGQSFLKIGGSGTFSSTLYTTRYQQ